MCKRARPEPSPRRCPRRRTRFAIAATAAAVVLGPETGHAQPVASSTDPPPRGEPVVRPAPPPSDEPTAADAAGAPVPGEESGRLDPVDPGDSPTRLIGRGILFLPKLAIQAAVAPVRAGIWANERYRLYDRAYDLFFTDDRKLGLYPTAQWSSGFGLTGGARLVHRDLFGADEHFSLAARFGGRYHDQLTGALRSGRRLGGHLRLELEAEHDRRPEERFYGLGNRDEERLEMVPPAPLDAQGSGAAVETRYRQRLARAALVADVRVAGPLRLRGSGALSDVEVGRGDEGLPIDEVYMPGSLTGWAGARHAYTELELRWDDRRRGSRWEPAGLPAIGWYAGVYAGRTHRLDEGADFWRYGADVQRFFRIARGPRVIAVRAHVEAVDGARGEVPFFELPALGGATFLRGYHTERFRDRIAALGSLDYQWDLSTMFAARVFADVGRVYGAWEDLELSGLRVGYGIGLEAYSKTSFVVRTSVASSIDGGVHLNLSFEPVFEVGPRVERR
jgi:hypothetical protein